MAIVRGRTGTRLPLVRYFTVRCGAVSLSRGAFCFTSGDFFIFLGLTINFYWLDNMHGNNQVVTPPPNDYLLLVFNKIYHHSKMSKSRGGWINPYVPPCSNDRKCSLSDLGIDKGRFEKERKPRRRLVTFIYQEPSPGWINSSHLISFSNIDPKIIAIDFDLCFYLLRCITS